ncbi:MAG: hypothetical protein ABIJ96_07640 [Elusimicrobiota bacterium]
MDRARLIERIKALFAAPRATWLARLAILVSLAWLCHSSLGAHIKYGSVPLIFNDDSRQYTWLFLIDKQEPRAEDYLYNYRKASLPLGYKLLYGAQAKIGDPRTLSKVLPYLLLMLVLAGTAAAAGMLGGHAAAWGAMLFCLSSGIFLERMTGGHPRAFAYPIIAWMAYALIAGRPGLMAALTILGAAFYPVAAVLGGLTLAGWMFLSAKDRGGAESWPAQKRWLLLGGTAAATVFLVLPIWLSMRSYGPQMRARDVAAYPEYGLDGRYNRAVDRPPYQGFWYGAGRYARESLEGTGWPWSIALRRWGSAQRYKLRMLFGLLALAGLFHLALTHPGVRRLLILAALLLPVHMLATAVAPSLYLPQRYVVYAVPILAVVLFPAALAAAPNMLPELRAEKRAGPLLVVLACAAMNLFLGGRGPTETGYYVQINRGEWVYPYLATLPADSLIAGWPGPESIIDNVPYVSARSAFVTFENHEAYYQGFVIELRRRMRALIDAYYAVDAAPLRRLRDEFGVTHILVDPKHFQDKPAVYFTPFNFWARDAFLAAEAAGKGFELPRWRAAAGFHDDRVWVLDLKRLDK